MIDPNIQRIIDSNKKFKKPLRREKKVHRDIVVRYMTCKHTTSFKADDPKAPAWVVGAERVDSSGKVKALEIYSECPECIKSNEFNEFNEEEKGEVDINLANSK